MKSNIYHIIRDGKDFYVEEYFLINDLKDSTEEDIFENSYIFGKLANPHRLVKPILDVNPQLKVFIINQSLVATSQKLSKTEINAVLKLAKDKKHE